MVLFFNLGGNLRPQVLFVITTFIYKLQTNIFKKYFVNVMSFGVISILYHSRVYLRIYSVIFASQSSFGYGHWSLILFDLCFWLGHFTFP